MEGDEEMGPSLVKDVTGEEILEVPRRDRFPISGSQN